MELNSIEDAIFATGEAQSKNSEQEKLQVLISSHEYHNKHIKERVDLLKSIVDEYKHTGRVPDIPLGGMTDDLRVAQSNHIAEVVKALYSSYKKTLKDNISTLKEERKKLDNIIKQQQKKK